MKSSDIIRDSCCGKLLDVPVSVLTKQVLDLESQIVFLTNQLDNAIKEIERIINENKRT
jgi:hypothetical protein